MFKLKSAIELAREDDGVKIPSYTARKSVRVGQKVRLIFTEGDITEWLWVEIISKSGARYVGKLLGSIWNYRNRNTRIKSAKIGTAVPFVPRHIYSIRS